MQPLEILSSRPKDAVRMPEAGWDPSLWATKIPLTHRENFAEVFRAIWENRDRAAYAWRILNDGVCDGCALGTSGLSDWTIEGIHLCNIRLRLLSLNTMGALQPEFLSDIGPLRSKKSSELREMGRLPTPMIRRSGDPGFQPVGWDEALDIIAQRLAATSPDRTYTYLTSRGIPNETYYVVQKVIRALGTNNIDNAARVCHSPSTFGLKGSLGVGATTCSYTDLIGTDLITFIGCNPAKNQPVLMKYLFHARKAGTKVALVNPMMEPGMDSYWIPSDAESALFGTKMTDEHFAVRPEGDRAFLTGAVKAMFENDWVDRDFIDGHTTGFEGLTAHVEALGWETLEKSSGLERERIVDYARMLAEADKAVFVWGMGITQHNTGEDNVQTIVNLALTKGFVGREGCGLMPIRGHSGVQGGAEMGAYARVYPGGRPVGPEAAAEMSELWGFDVPDTPAMTTSEALEAAAEGNLDVLLAIGGNFREVMPGPGGIDEGMGRIPLRVHIDITLSSQMLTDPADTVIILPTTTRYEMPGGVTETSTERRIIFSPEIPGPRIADARPEWEIFRDLLRRTRPDLAETVDYPDTAAIRDEIARVIPMYEGIEHLSEKGDSVQYGGERLCEGWVFPTSDGLAHLKPTPVGTDELADDEYIVITRRGKQFNSMVLEEVDPMGGYRRDAVMISPVDAGRNGLADGDSVRLTNAYGDLEGVISVVPLVSGAVQVHWPEGNVLVDPVTRSPQADIPPFKSTVARLERLDPS
ncbi:MAG: FdhF/YdeP family oxidoreductase [Acidimicrobiia bacterium]|nr:FdhF/YdeP family oxidoreductase [Acidimicrobiia bacterium]